MEITADVTSLQYRASGILVKSQVQLDLVVGGLAKDSRRSTKK